MTPSERLREALDYLLDATAGAQSGYIPGCSEDTKWGDRFTDARNDATAALAELDRVQAEQTKAVPQHYAHPAGGYWLIYFHDGDRRPEIFTDEAAARRRWGQISASWNADLFQRIERNYQDDHSSSAATAPSAATAAGMPEEPFQSIIGPNPGLQEWKDYARALRAFASSPKPDAELLRDAQRYRWLRDADSWEVCFSEKPTVGTYGMTYRCGSRWVRKALDAAIDTALSQAERGGD